MIADKIKEQREELINHPAMKFANDAIVLQAIRSGTSGYVGENLDDWYKNSIKQILQALIEREEKSKTNIIKKKNSIENDPFHPARCQYLGQQDAKQDTIDYLKSELAKISN